MTTGRLDIRPSTRRVAIAAHAWRLPVSPPARRRPVIRNNRTGASEAVVGALPIEVLASAIERFLGAKP